MPKRSSKRAATRTPDANQIAARIIADATGEGDTAERNDRPMVEPVSEKNPAAVALGRLGGLKGGKARAAKLSKKRRSEIARDAALRRWSDHNEKSV